MYILYIIEFYNSIDIYSPQGEHVVRFLPTGETHLSSTPNSLPFSTEEGLPHDSLYKSGWWQAQLGALQAEC